MKLTLNTFFSNYILDPCTLPTAEERRIATIASIACGILSLGIIHAVCALFRCLKTRNIVDQTHSQQSSNASLESLKNRPKLSSSHHHSDQTQRVQSSHVSLESLKTRPNPIPPHNILDLIEKRIEQTKAPTNAVECLIYTGFQQAGKSVSKTTGITNELFLNDWEKCNDTSEGLSGVGVNALFDAHFGHQADCASMDPSTGKYLGNKQTPSIVYCSMTEQGASTADVAKIVKTILENEKNANPTHRPDKIFIPLFWQHGVGHFTLLVVEPKNHPARITMINTNGDDINRFHEYEKAALKAAKKVYPDAKYARNTETIWAEAGTSCAYDVVDLALSLSKAPNAQEVIVKKLWPRKNEEEDLVRRLKHKEALARFFCSYAHSVN